MAALSELFDATTCRALDRTGIGPGWRCWEVGAGGPQIATWMADRVGPDGSVLATDIDLSWLGPPDERPFTLLRHDVAADDPPPGPLDLIHARLVLVHLPGRERVLASLAGALRPGGWLVVEDADPALQPLACIDESGPEQALANKLHAGFRVLLARRGVDLSFGRTLPRVLRAFGLEQVGADAYFPVVAPASAVLERATIEQIRDGLIVAGLATAEEIDRCLEAISAGRLDLATAPLISAWGRKPAGSIVA